MNTKECDKHKKSNSEEANMSICVTLYLCKYSVSCFKECKLCKIQGKKFIYFTSINIGLEKDRTINNHYYSLLKR